MKDVLIAVLCAVASWLGHARAVDYEQRKCRRLWGLPPWAWSVVWGLAPVGGAALFAIAAKELDGQLETDWRLVKAAGGFGLALFGLVAIAIAYVDVTESGGTHAWLADVVALCIGVALIGTAVAVWVRLLRRYPESAT